MSIDVTSLWDGTGDWSNTLQFAVSRQLETGQALDIPPGQYHLPRPVRIPSSVGLQWRGEGWRSELLAAPSLNGPMVEFDSADGEVRGFRMADLRLTGNHAEQAAGGGILAEGAVQCHFNRLWIHGCYDYAITIGKIEGPDLFGHHNRISDGLIDGGRASAGLGNGIVIVGSDENMIRDMDIEDMGTTGDPETGGVIDMGGLTTVTGGAMVNCEVGYRVKDTGRVSLNGIKFDGCKRYAVVISGDECKVIGATFLEGAEGEPYLLMNNGGGNQVVANDFTTPSNRAMRSAIQETGNSRENIVCGNVSKISKPASTNFTRAAYERRKPSTGEWHSNTTRLAF